MSTLAQFFRKWGAIGPEKREACIKMSQKDAVGPSGIPADCDSNIAAMVQYWRSISPEGLLPGRQHLDPTDIPRMLQDVWLIDVQRDPLDFLFRLVGTGVAAYFGTDPTGKRLEDVFDDFKNTLAFRDFCDVVEYREPRWRRGQPMLAPTSKIEKLERVYLPLARDGSDVDMIFCYTVFNP